MTDFTVQAIPDSDTTGFAPDVIVVGSGSAGAAAARRLVDRGARVLLLEAGGPDVNPAIHDPGRLHELWLSEVDWAYETVPQRHASDRRLGWPRGRVLGGSSCLNAMIWVRGAREDYDNWAYGGADGWSWDDVRPVFERIERRDPAAGDGIVTITSGYDADADPPGDRRRRPGGGIAFNPDYNPATQDGVSYMQFSIKEGVRHSDRRCLPQGRRRPPEPARAPRGAGTPAAVCGHALHRRGVVARRPPRARLRGRGGRRRRNDRLAATAAAVRRRAERSSWPRMASMSSPTCPASARTCTTTCSRRSSSALSARSGRRRPACPPARRTSSGARVLASPSPTCSPSTSWCRCTSRGCRAPRTGSP